MIFHQSTLTFNSYGLRTFRQQQCNVKGIARNEIEILLFFGAYFNVKSSST